MKTTSLRVLRHVLVVAATLLLDNASGRAATYTWSGVGFMGSQDFLWSNPFNWVGNAAPQTGETNVIIVLPNNGAPRNTTNDIAGLVIKAVRFQGDNYVVAGKTPGQVITLQGDRFVGDSIDVTGDNCHFAPTLSLALTNSISAEVPNAKTFLLRSSLSGPGGFTKNGGGTLHFNSPGNSYQGDTFVTDGILDLQCGLFGPTVAVPGDLSIGGTNETLFPVVRLLNDDQISDAANVAVHANAKLWLNTNNDAIGSLTMAGGLVNTGLGGSSSMPGTLTLNGNVTNKYVPMASFATISGKLHLGNVTRSFHVETSSELAIDASIGGNVIFPPGLTKTGGGLLTLYNATNTYGGATLIDGGAIKVSGSTQLLGNTNSGTIVSTNGQLQLEAFSVGQEALTLNGGLLLSLSYSGTNSWAGPITLIGNCRVQGNLTFGDRDDLTLSGAITGSGSLTKQGDGVLHLTGSGANTFSGGLFASGGWTKLAKNPAVPALSGPLVVGTSNAYLPSIYVQVEASHQIPDSTPITILHGTLDVENGATETLGNVELVGGWILNSAGALTLSGNVTNRAADLTPAIYGRIDLAAGTRIFHSDAGATCDVNGSLNGAGALTKTGVGSLTFKNTNSYGGLTLIKDGFLRCIQNGRPGSSLDGTEIEPAGVLSLDRISLTNETITLHGHPANYALYVRDQCAIVGNVSLLGEAGVEFENANGLTNRLTINGAIGGGAGGLRVDGDGELVLGGATDNSFGGQLWVRSSDAKFQKSSGALAVNGMLRIGESNAPASPGRTVTLAANNQIGNSTPVEILDNGELKLGTFSDAIGALTLRGGFASGSGTLTLGGDVICRASPTSGSAIGVSTLNLGGVTRQIQCDHNASLYIGGNVVDGGGNAGVTKTGPGFLGLAGGFSTYAGPTVASAGILELTGNPGSSAAGTEVMPGASLRLYNTQVTNEVLTLHGNPDGSPIVEFVLTNNFWTGPVTLDGQVGIQASGLFTNNGTPVTLRIDGPISGNGSLIFGGVGTLSLGGNAANTFNGTTTVREGTMRLEKTGANNVAIPGSLIVGRTNNSVPAYLRTGGPNQFNANAAFTHTYLPSAQLLCQGFDQRVPKLLLIAGQIDTGGGFLALDGDVAVGRDGNASSSIQGKVLLGSIAATTGTRTLTVSNLATLNLYADIADGPLTTNLTFVGGALSLYNSNSFSGAFVVNGALYAHHSDVFGKPSGRTIVETNGFIGLMGIGSAAKPVAEPFTFVNTPPNYFTLTAYGSNYLSGAMNVEGHFVCDVVSSNNLLQLSGPISGGGSEWLQEGSGTLRLTGTNANTFTGLFYQAFGKLELARTNANAIGGPLKIGNQFGAAGDVIARWFGSNQVADASAVIVSQAGQLELQNFNETIGSLAGSGNVLLGSAALTVGSDGTSTAFAGFISGIGGQLVKTGPGTMTLSGNNSYTGGSTVNDGVLLVNGQQPQSPVSLLGGGQIGGNGRVGNISALNGHVSPGASPGKLTSGNLSFFSPSSLLKLELNGTNPGVTYDQVEVNGTVLLMGGALQIAMNFPGAVSNEYVVVKNDGLEPISGTLVGVTNGASITNNGVVFLVRYDGGDGNDIALIQMNVASGAQISGIQLGAGDSMQVSANGFANAIYIVQATTNLNAPALWIDIGTAPSDANGFMQFIDNEARLFPMRFYRFVNP